MSLRYSALSTSYLAKLTADFHSVCPDVIERAMNVCFWLSAQSVDATLAFKSRSARVSKPKVSRDRSLSCQATRLSCECAPPAVPQLLLGHTALKPRTYLRPTAYPLHLLRLRKSVASTA